MLYHLLYPLQAEIGGFRVFRYISFRVLMAMLTALVISFLLGPVLIRLLQKLQVGEKIREEGPKSHQGKSGTPTMGGILIVASMIFAGLLWIRWDSPLAWVVLIGTACFGVVGFVDDYLKLRGSASKGLSIRNKLKLQIVCAFAIAAAMYYLGLDTRIPIPFFKDVTVDLQYFFFPFAALVIVASSNAVNITDGLDGLAIGPVLVASLSYLLLTYIAGHSEFSRYLQVFYVAGSGELAVFCAAIVGAGLGFLWFNTYPAQVFMGDVGSLSLGAALGMIALVCKQEFLLIIIGGVFVVETVSVIIQIISYRTTGKRVFRMAPIHHHFELKGWAEPKIIVRFWIISIVLAILAFSTLKLR